MHGRNSRKKALTSFFNKTNPQQPQQTENRTVKYSEKFHNVESIKITMVGALKISAELMKTWRRSNIILMLVADILKAEICKTADKVTACLLGSTLRSRHFDVSLNLSWMSRRYVFHLPSWLLLQYFSEETFPSACFWYNRFGSVKRRYKENVWNELCKCLWRSYKN